MNPHKALEVTASISLAKGVLKGLLLSNSLSEMTKKAIQEAVDELEQAQNTIYKENFMNP